MILSDVQTRVTRQFGDAAGAVIAAADVARWATDAQLEVVRKTKLNETDTVTASIQGTRVYVIANVLEVRRVKYDGTPLRQVSVQELDALYPARSTTGYGQDTPHHYRATEYGIEVFPIPANNLGIITVTHTKRPSPVVNPTDVFEIPEQYHELIVRRVLERCYETDGQWTAADRMHTQVKEEQGEALHDKATGGGDSYPAVRALSGDMGDA